MFIISKVVVPRTIVGMKNGMHYSNKKGDSDNKRTRSSAEQLSDQEQPSNKRQPSAMSVVIHDAQNMMFEARELPTAEARSFAMRSAVRHVTSAGNVRNQEREEEAI